MKTGSDENERKNLFPVSVKDSTNTETNGTK
jgi:hypothetical protein